MRDRPRTAVQDLALTGLILLWVLYLYAIANILIGLTSYIVALFSGP